MPSSKGADNWGLKSQDFCTEEGPEVSQSGELLQGAASLATGQGAHHNWHLQGLSVPLSPTPGDRVKKLHWRQVATLVTCHTASRDLLCDPTHWELCPREGQRWPEITQQVRQVHGSSHSSLLQMPHIPPPQLLPGTTVVPRALADGLDPRGSRDAQCSSVTAGTSFTVEIPSSGMVVCLCESVRVRARVWVCIWGSGGKLTEPLSTPLSPHKCTKGWHYHPCFTEGSPGRVPSGLEHRPHLPRLRI